MLSEHEFVVKVREKFLPKAIKMDAKATALFCKTVGRTGPTGIRGDNNDVNVTIQLLRASANMLESSAIRYGISVVSQNGRTGDEKDD